MACHPDKVSDLGTGTDHDFLSQVSFTVGSGETKDLVVWIHMQNCANTNQTVTVTAILNKAGVVGPYRQCTHDITIEKC
jgi:hypothetical protein